MVIVLRACQREIESLSEEVRGDLADAPTRLDAGLSLTMPLSRPMPSIGPGIHELRLKDRSGTYRVVYALIRSGHGSRAPRIQEDDERHAGEESGVGQEAIEGGSVMNRRSSATHLAKRLRIPKSRALEAVLKAQLIAAVVREVSRRGLTHADLAERSGLPRSAVTGILSGSLQKVTIDRVLRLLEAAGLEAKIKVSRAA
jgi:predicted XRE-type DNA-binding protein